MQQKSNYETLYIYLNIKFEIQLAPLFQRFCREKNIGSGGLMQCDKKYIIQLVEFITANCFDFWPLVISNRNLRLIYSQIICDEIRRRFNLRRSFTCLEIKKKIRFKIKKKLCLFIKSICIIRENNLQNNISLNFSDKIHKIFKSLFNI